MKWKKKNFGIICYSLKNNIVYYYLKTVCHPIKNETRNYIIERAPEDPRMKTHLKSFFLDLLFSE